jgi:hypothetical protein
LRHGAEALKDLYLGLATHIPVASQCPNWSEGLTYRPLLPGDLVENY